MKNFEENGSCCINLRGALYKRSQDPKGYLNISCSKEQTKMNLTSFDIPYQ